MESTEKDKREYTSGKGRKNHLKWPLIIIAILLVVLVVFFDYCSRTGKI